MNNTHIQLNTKTYPTSVGPVAFARTALFTIALVAAGVLAPSYAFACSCTLTASASSVEAGSPVTLTWTSTVQGDGSTFTIDNGVGQVSNPSSGSVVVYPTADTTYNATAYEAAGSGTCSTSVVVTTPPACHEYVPGVDPDLFGTVTKGNATLTIPDNYCPVKVTFASYDIPDGKPLPFSHQVLNDHVTDVYGSGNHNVGPLTLKSCNWQNDLYVGDVVTVLPDDIHQHPKVINFDMVSGKTCAPPPVCHLTIDKSVDKSSATPGDTVEYTINFKNDGTAVCTGGGVEITDAVDSRLTYVSETHSPFMAAGYDGTNLYTASDRTLHWNAWDLQPGDSGTIKWKATVGTPTACSETVPNVAKISADQYDNFHTWVESNNAPVTVTKTCTPPPACHLKIDKSVDKTSAAPGDKVTYTINFSNDGGSDCTGSGVKVVDVVDPRLTYVSETHSTGVLAGYVDTPVYTTDDHTLHWNAGTLKPGGSGSVTWTATVGTPTACSETVPNTAKITSLEYDHFATWIDSNTVSFSVAKSCGGGGTPPPACTLSADPATLAVGGGNSTLSWTTTNATAFTIDHGVGSVTPVAAGATTTSTAATVTYTGTATGSDGSTITCSSTVTVPPPVTGCVSHCGGGGGGGSPSPHILFAALPHVGEQPLAYLYLSQIPQTGLSFGPVGTVIYWTALIAWALALAYLVLFGAVPVAHRSIRGFGLRVKEVLNAPTATATVVEERIHRVAPVIASTPAPVVHAPITPKAEEHEAPRGYSSYDGFKSFAREGTLSIDDIVKGLARSHAAPVVAPVKPEPVHAVAPNVEPVYEHVEPIYQNVEPIMNEPMSESVPAVAIPTNTRGFVAALIEGDRNAVFAGLRQYTRGAGASEKLISDVACLLDDAYRARMDGTSSDADIVRLVARLDTPTLEKLVASLTTAIDSSYTTGVTGAKMALTRALGVLGA